MMKKQPDIVVPGKVTLPAVETVVLGNGLHVHMIRTAGQQVARVSLVWAAGSAVQSQPFVASSTLNLLAEGSEALTAHQIAERLDFVGSYFDVSIDRDFAVATFCCLGKFFEPTLEMISEIVLHPAFPEDEVALYARKRMERLALERSKPATKARELFSAALFGESHPYGISSPESEYLKLRREDVRGFFERFYGAGNCFVVCSLGEDEGQREALLELLSGMPLGANTNHPVSRLAGCPHQPPSSARHSQLAARDARIGYAPSTGGELPSRRVMALKGSVQSAVRVGRLLFPRGHEDFVGMQVVATILGGYFGSRLIQNLREERGYTYGVMAAMVNLRAAGYLAIATEVAAEATGDAVEQIFGEMERLRNELVGEDELENVRRSMLGEVMRILDGPFGIVDVVIENIQVCGNGGDSAHNYINDFIRQIEATTPERVRELARKYLVREKFTTVIVGRE